MGGKRKIHLDFLRILAAFLVLVHHSELMELLDHTQSGIRGIFVLSCMTSYVFVNVPLFFMISGALLLGREESDRVIYGRRFPRFLLLTFLVNLFTYVYRCYPSFIAGDFFRGFFGGIMDETHWYLYAYLGLLVCLPFLRRAARGMTHTEAIVLVCMRFLFYSLLPGLNCITNYKGYPAVPVSSAFTVPLAVVDILFYPIMGYYLEEKLPWEKADWRWAAASVAVICGGIGAGALMNCHAGLRMSSSGSLLRLFSYAAAMATFVLAKYLFTRGRCRQWFEGILKTASSLMLGVYILEPVLRPAVKPLLIGWMGEGASPAITAGWYCVSGLVVYAAITWLLKKLPVLRKIL